MKKNLQCLISILFLSFSALTKPSYAADVTIGFDKPIKNYIEQTGRKSTTWYYMLNIEYPNGIQKETAFTNRIASGKDRMILPKYDLLNSDRPFKIILHYGHILTNTLYEHNLEFFIPVHKRSEDISKIRIFLNLNMSNDEKHTAKIARVEYVTKTNSDIVDANPLSKTIDE